MSVASPAVSVILPVYNGERFLSEAVNSVQNQKYNPLETIIVDDGSTDKTATVAAGLKGNIRYVYQENAGPAVARNKGLEIASGSIIAFIDADDIWTQNKLEIQLECLARNPDSGIVRGQIQRVCPVRNIEGKIEFENHGTPFAHYILGSAIIRKSAFDKVGYFDPGLFIADDVDWFLRAKEAGIKTIIIENPVLIYRMHDNNIMRDKLRRDECFMGALKKSLDRRLQNES